MFRLVDGRVQPSRRRSRVYAGRARSVWAKFLQPVPPRHYHGIFAMHYRVPDFTIHGDQLVFMQHAHVVRRVLEIGKWLALGRALPVPVSLAPRTGPRAVPKVQGGYVPVSVGGVTYQIYYETAGSGRDVLCMHTAGSDGRQFHGLMADERITQDHRLVAFDLPWHGKSLPPEGSVPGSWRLNTDLYVDLIMGFVAAAGLDKPIALGASMSGEICLELAYRHPEAFSGIVACEACEKINQRQNSWAAHPAVNQTLFVPEWIRALSAPQSPAEYQEAITWHYSQGGALVFYGDIAFYSGEWDARERVGRIDTNRCRLFMLTGRIRLLLHGRIVRGDGGENTGRPVPGDGGDRAFPVRGKSAAVRVVSAAGAGGTESLRLRSLRFRGASGRGTGKLVCSDWAGSPRVSAGTTQKSRGFPQ